MEVPVRCFNYRVVALLMKMNKLGARNVYIRVPPARYRIEPPTIAI